MRHPYDQPGNLTNTTLPNGVSTVNGYDLADRLTSVVNNGPGGTISSFTYSLDDAGNRTQMVDLSGSHAYDYDDLYRLTQVTYPDPETALADQAEMTEVPAELDAVERAMALD